MAVLTSCCLNLPSNSNPSSIAPSQQPSKPINQVPRGRNKEDGAGAWRKRCFVSMACMIIGAESGALIGAGEGGWAAVNTVDHLQLIAVEAKNRNAVKWSDRRACPPWNMNSLETIVPENLPRPFHRRISESVGQTSKFTTSSNRPTVKLTVKANPNCFSM